MNKKILIIDDEVDILKVLAARLKEYKFEVDTALNGNDGIAKIKMNPPDLIILDIMMPAMSGIEVADMLKKNRLYAHIPIIFLSALQSKEDEKVQGNLIGNNFIFAKPYDIKDLVAKIEELI